MKPYLANLRRHVTRLHRFSGREGVGDFWIWTASVLVTTTCLFMLAAIPIIAASIARIEAFARAHPEQATRTIGPGHYSVQIDGFHPELMPDFGAFIALTAGFAALVILLIAAALVRRLHDRGTRGWIALLPLPFLATGLWIMPRLMRAADPDLGLFAILFANNLVYLASIGLLVFLTTRPGSPGDNRYGPPSP